MTKWNEAYLFDEIKQLSLTCIAVLAIFILEILSQKKPTALCRIITILAKGDLVYMFA